MMYPAFEIMTSLVAFTFIAILAYGVFTHQREWFTLGICCFNIIPLVGGFYYYSLNNELVHLAIIMVFMSQVIITLPVKINYGSDNSSAFVLGVKIGVSILLTNLFNGCFILSTELGIPNQFGYYHLAIALIMLYPIIKSNYKKDVRWK